MKSCISEYIKHRVINMAACFINKKCTMEQLADIYCVSISTVYNDLINILPRINSELHKDVLAVIKEHKGNRYRGQVV